MGKWLFIILILAALVVGLFFGAGSYRYTGADNQQYTALDWLDQHLGTQWFMKTYKDLTGATEGMKNAVTRQGRALRDASLEEGEQPEAEPVDDPHGVPVPAQQEGWPTD